MKNVFGSAKDYLNAGQSIQLLAGKTSPALLLLIVTWVVMCSPWLFAKRTVPYDSKAEFYPTLYFVAQSLRGGELPFWNPYVYSGYPIISDPQALIFSPIALIAMTLVEKPTIHWFDAIELFHILLAGVGMFFVCLRFGYGQLAALFSALVYMFGGSAAGRLQHVPIILAYSYFPWALLTLDLALARASTKWAICFGIVAGVMAAHQNQVAYLFAIVLLGYVSQYVIRSGDLKGFIVSRWKILTGAFVAGTLTLIVPLYTTLQFLPLSNRPRISFESATQNSSLYPPAYLTLFVSNFFNHKRPAEFWGPNDVTETFLYVGTIPIVLIVLHGIWTGAFFEKAFRYFSGVSILAVLYSLGAFTPFYWLVYQVIPGVNLYRRPADATFVLNMVLALATGFLMDRLLRAKRRQSSWFLMIGSLSLICSLFVWGFRYASEEGKLSASYLRRDVFLAAVFTSAAVIVLTAIAKQESVRSRNKLGFVAFALLVADLGLHNAGSRLNAEPGEAWVGLNPRIDQADPLLTFLSGPAVEINGDRHRVEIIQAGWLWLNAPMIYRIEATQGYNPLRYALYGRVIGADEGLVVSRTFTRLMPHYSSPLFDLLGVRYIVSVGDVAGLTPQNGEGSVQLVKNEGIKAWLNRDAFPRVITPTTIYVENEIEDAIAEGRIATVDFRNTVVLSHVPRMLQNRASSAENTVMLAGEGSVETTIVSYRNNDVVIAVSADKESILVLNDLYYPYWRVYVDGTEQELLQANYVFRGVYVPSGQHQVIFRFEPFSRSAIRGTIARLKDATTMESTYESGDETQ